jgi:hypothetical protein
MIIQSVEKKQYIVIGYINDHNLNKTNVTRGAIVRCNYNFKRNILINETSKKKQTKEQMDEQRQK